MSSELLPYRNTGHSAKFKCIDSEKPFLKDKRGIAPNDKEYESCKLKAVIDYGPFDSYNAAVAAVGENAGPDDLLILFTCFYCDLIFKNPKRYLIHLKWHTFGTHDSFNRNLTRIKQIRDENERLQESSARKRKNPFQNNNPSKKLKSNKSKRKLSEFKCQHCSKGFNAQVGLNNHILLDHLLNKNNEDNSSRDKSDSTCSKENDSVKETIIQNETIIPEVAGFKCILCSESFSTRNLLKCHIENKHVGGSAIPLPKTRSVCETVNPVSNGVVDSKNTKLNDNKVEQESDWNPKIILQKISLTGFEVFPCIRCNEIFDTRRLLRRHKRKDCNVSEYNSNSELENLKVQSTNIFQCHHCDLIVRNKKAIKNHLKNIHDPDNQREGDYPCKVCNRKFRQRYALALHLYNVHGSYKKCEHCSKEFRYTSELYHHILKYHFNEALKCDYCDERFVTKNKLNAHKKKVHQKQECEYCNLPYNNKGQYRDHLILKHPDKLFKCQQCGIMLSTKSTLNIHIQYYHKDNPKGLECPDCNEIYYRPSSLTRHIRKVHKKEKTKKCHYCNKYFYETREVNQHVREEHSEKLISCNQCSTVTISTGDMRSHVRRVHSRIECRYCHIICPKNRDLNKHIQEVHADQMIQCDLCKTLLLDVVSYRKHVKRVHKKVENSVCPECKTTFRYKGSLKRHMIRSHTKKKKKNKK